MPEHSPFNPHHLGQLNEYGPPNETYAIDDLQLPDDEKILLADERIVVDTVLRTMFAEGKPTSLSTEAYSLVELFARHADTTLDPSKIVKTLWPKRRESNLLQTGLKRIRGQLGKSLADSSTGAVRTVMASG